jgi:hypothetical protein
MLGDVAADGDPPGVGEGLEVGGTAEAGACAGGENASERDVGFVVDGLIVDVDDAGGMRRARSRPRMTSRVRMPQRLVEECHSSLPVR